MLQQAFFGPAADTRHHFCVGFRSREKEKEFMDVERGAMSNKATRPARVLVRAGAESVRCLKILLHVGG